jgi:hypothetical protein
MYSPSDVKINQVRMEAFPDSERRQDRRFNRKGVVMNIHLACEVLSSLGISHYHL